MAAIPRMRDWVAQHYPGIKIGIGEYSWGATESVNGALAQAMALGIFAREGLDLAAHWGGFKPGTPGYIAFKLYGNYDSRGSAFGGMAFSASSSHDDLLTCFAAEPDAGHTALLMVVNVSPDSDLTPTIHLRNWTGAPPRGAAVWRFWPGDDLALAQGPDVALPPGSPITFTYTFPASSITLLRLEASA
jgi:hypothetical protein